MYRCIQSRCTENVCHCLTLELFKINKNKMGIEWKDPSEEPHAQLINLHMTKISSSVIKTKIYLFIYF